MAIALRPTPSMAVKLEAQKMLLTVLSDKFDDLVKSWEGLKPSQKWDVFLRVLPFVLPRLNATSVNMNTQKSSAESIVARLVEEISPTKAAEPVPDFIAEEVD